MTADSKVRQPRWTSKQIAVFRAIHEAKRPVTGADIARSLGMNRGHVYPILRRLRETGFLLRVEERQQGCPPRWFYRLAPAGRDFYNKQGEL